MTDKKMAINFQILLSLLAVSQIYCLDEHVFTLGNGAKFSLYDTSVNFQNFTFNYTQIKNIVEYKINGALDTKPQKSVFYLDAIYSVSVNSDNIPYVDECYFTLSSPKDRISQLIYSALEKFIYHDICISPNDSNNLDFGTIVGKNKVHFKTVVSALENVKTKTHENIEKYDEHQRGIDTLVDMALSIGLKKLQNYSYINLNDIEIPNLKLSNVKIGNFSTITRAKPFEIYRQNETLTIVAAFKIRLHMFITTKPSFWKIPLPTMKFTALAEKIEVGIKVQFDYSNKPCRITISDLNMEKEKLAIFLVDASIVGPLVNPVLSLVELYLTPDRLVPPMKNEMQKLLDGDGIRSELELLRPLFQNN